MLIIINSYKKRGKIITHAPNQTTAKRGIRSGKPRKQQWEGEEGPGSEGADETTCKAWTKPLLRSRETSSKVMAAFSGRHCCILVAPPPALSATPAPRSEEQREKGNEEAEGTTRKFCSERKQRLDLCSPSPLSPLNCNKEEGGSDTGKRYFLITLI